MSLLDEYKKYHTDRTDAEIRMGIVVFLQIIGNLMGVKCYNNLAPHIIHHNMYVALIGPSTRSRKTSVQDIVKWLFPKNRCHPDETSPEQFIAELEANPANMWWFGEWSKILKRIGTGHYMSDIAELKNVIFDCPEEYIKKLRGKDGDGKEFKIKWPHLSFNTTLTEEVLIKHIDEEMVHGGYFARFIMAKGGAKDKKRKILTREQRDHAGNLKSIVYQLEHLCPFFNTVVFQLTEEALDKHYEIEKEMCEYEGVGSFAGRYSNYIVAVADILMVCEKLGEYIDKPEELRKVRKLTDLFKLDDGKIMVTPEYLEQAWEILKPYLKYSQKVVDLIKVDVPVRKLLNYMDGRGKVTYSKAMNGSGLNVNTMKLAVDTLEQSDRLYKDEEITRSMANRDYKKVFLWLKKGV